jgi:predicted dehydrogenase
MSAEHTIPSTGAVRWGILGAVSIAERFATDAAHAEGAMVAAAGARDGERSAAFAARHGIPVAHAGYDALLADPDVDIVYIATPHSLHFENALAAIRAGKPVLVEKPFTVTAEQAERLRNESESHGVFVMEALWSVCNPVVQRLRERLEAGAIGTPLGLTANVGPLGVPVQRGGAGRLEDPSLGASFMLEALVYPLWLTTIFLPSLREPTTVSAAATFSPAGIDEVAGLLLAGADGSVASLGGGIAFATAGGPPSVLQITSSAGWAEISDDIFDPQSARVGTPDGIEVITADGPSRGFAWEIEEAGRAFRSGRLTSELVPLDQSVQVMHILDRARRSAVARREGTTE